MVFWLSGKMVALYLDNSIANTYLCNQGDTISLFFQTCMPAIVSD